MGLTSLLTFCLVVFLGRKEASASHATLSFFLMLALLILKYNKYSDGDGNTNGDSEIPMVAAIPALDYYEGDYTMVSCRNIDLADDSDGDNDGDGQPSSTITASATATSLPASSVRVMARSSATTAVSALGMSSVVVQQAEREAVELATPSSSTTATEHHQPQSTCTSCSPNSTALLATPEPVPRRNTHNNDTTNDSPMMVAPLEITMDALASPDPSMVVTDERYAQTPATTGKWKTTLCSCWCDHDVLCSSLPWMSCCCNVILLGQLMTRLRLNWCGREDHEAAVRTFGIIVSITFCYLLLCATGVGMFAAPFFIIWLVILATRIRRQMRRHFQIPPLAQQEQQNDASHRKHCCCRDNKGLMEDFCCSLWCSCCVTIQMARQTHDEKRYPYECFSPTGLPTYAPDVPRACRIER